MTKIDIRTSCKVCNSPITENRFRTYCSKKCRNKFHNSKPGRVERSVIANRAKRDMIAEKPSPDKIKCLICNRYYVQVGSHIVLAHGYESAREYRKEYGFDVKKGQLPDWFRKIKSEQVTEKALENLKQGKKFWFKKGDSKAGRYDRSEQTLNRLKNNN